MQQGRHIGKIVVKIRDGTGTSQLGSLNSSRKKSLSLENSASYLLVGGLGGLGRSVSIWMAKHGARNLIFLSRNAGNGTHDQEFVRELESMGCTVQLIRGSVTDPEDVSRAVDGSSAPLKGIIHMSMILHDQAFQKMSIDEWNSVTQPKIQGTWNLHNITQSRGINLDFFVLFSSLAGVLGQPGQANYAAANAFLDAFVQYRINMNLRCSAIDIGAVEGIGHLSKNPELFKKIQGTGYLAVQEKELLQALELAILSTATQQNCETSKTEQNSFLLGISPSVPLSDPRSSAWIRKDVRMAVYHNVKSVGATLGPADDTLRSLLIAGKNSPATFKSAKTPVLIAREIGKRLFSLLLQPDSEVNISLSLTELGMDSLIAVEMRAWWKQTFGFDISVLEMLGMGTLEALGKRATDGLVAMQG
jgi:NADP-dependent 3-hydroxy acid dehydrogenase YdfG/acyl carrier protein